MTKQLSVRPVVENPPSVVESKKFRSATNLAQEVLDIHSRHNIWLQHNTNYLEKSTTMRGGAGLGESWFAGSRWQE